MAATLRDVFDQFAAFGAHEPSSGLENRNFIKILKDARLLDKKLTQTDGDLIFTKVKPKGAKKIGFEEFQAALKLVAEKKGVAVAEVDAALLKAGGPVNNGTKAEANKFYDDKSTWGQGIHARGGPSTIDGNKNLSELCDRAPADKRGVSKTFAKQH